MPEREMPMGVSGKEGEEGGREGEEGGREGS